MEYDMQREGSHAVFRLKGSFSDADRDTFSEVQHYFHDASLRHITFDLEELTFIDSAALGMFLIAREASLNHGDIIFDIINVNGQPKRAFAVARFDMIMNVTMN